MLQKKFIIKPSESPFALKNCYFKKSSYNNKVLLLTTVTIVLLLYCYNFVSVIELKS